MTERREREAYYKAHKFGQPVGKILIGMTLVAVRGWCVMLGFMALHRYWPSIPAFGYGESLFLVAALMAIMGILKARYNPKDL